MPAYPIATWLGPKNAGKFSWMLEIALGIWDVCWICGKTSLIDHRYMFLFFGCCQKRFDLLSVMVIIEAEQPKMGKVNSILKVEKTALGNSC